MNGGTNRLPGQVGSLIDRSSTVTFQFEGKLYTGYAGDTIASALMANDCWIISRSFKYHRPRGALSMAAQDSNTLVQLQHEPNVFADRCKITDKLQVKGQNYRGSLDNDRNVFLEKFSKFMPVGFYYRTFMGPGKNTFLKVWEPLIRKMSGLGQISLDAPHEHYDKAFLFFDVLVVGGGPAGLAAAAEAADAGAKVLMVDENMQLGGSLTFERSAPAGSDRLQHLRELWQKVEGRREITIMSDAVCNAWHADNWMPVVKGNRLYKVRAKEIVIATGSFEQPVTFRNNDLPGIMLASAAQRLIKHFAIRPGKRAVVLTCNSQGYGAALDLKDADVDVIAIVDPRPDGGAGRFADEIRSAGIKILRGHGIREAEGTKRNRHVQRVFAAPLIDGATAYSDKGSWLRCDHVSVSGGYMPVYQLPVQAGAKLNYNDDTALFSINQLPRHAHLAGSVNGTFDKAAVENDGRRAGRQVAQALGLPVAETVLPEMAPEIEAVNFAWPLKPHPKGRDFIDFDEDLQINDLENAIAEGYSELELVKRFSTVGMGPSQGRHAALATARIVAGRTSRRVSDVGVTTARPPFCAEKLGVLAGNHRFLSRHTPMHHRHLELGAQMIPVGAWWRPAYYGATADQDRVIVEEVKAVREGVGILDVSTLGSLEVRGPDAVEFLNRLYTMKYDGLQVGRTRYLLLANEMGSLMDDGMVYRMADDQFYVTSTTGAVADVYRLMLFMNMEWGLKVDIVNATAAFAGVNVTGPKARTLLAPMTDDIDFSAEAFPYLCGGTGTVCGQPVRVMRIGFSGELSYEIHVPYSRGEALWDRIVEAGRNVDLRPYGLEASRILRLEKGHFIIGQDTDAMTTPEQVGMQWAVSKKKPYFLSKRSVEQRRTLGTDRKLVGFETEEKSAQVFESCLVMDGRNPVGFVTSTCWSPTLEKRIGLAYAQPNVAIGDMIDIRSRQGGTVQVSVVSPHFYDPENRRQEL